MNGLTLRRSESTLWSVISSVSPVLIGGFNTVNEQGDETKDRDSYREDGRKNLYQFRRHSEPYSTPAEMRSNAFEQIVWCFEKVIQWAEKAKKKTVIDTKITAVGQDSRHLVLDKKEGLPMFCGYEKVSDETREYLPSEIPVRVNYFTDRIVIEKKE